MSGNSKYDSTNWLAKYLLFHFGSRDDVLPPGDGWPAGMAESLGFVRRTAGYFDSHEVGRALDLGCAVGGATFELARSCREVIGVDSSEPFIQAAEVLRRGGTLPYPRLEEAHRQTPLTAMAPADVDLSRLRFIHGDATTVPDSLGSFDRVHVANLLCRLNDPQHLLERCAAWVVPGGQLVMATPGTWSEEFTPPARWPSGQMLDWLKAALGAAFVLERSAEEPFLIRESARKFEWSRSLVTLWRRRA